MKILCGVLIVIAVGLAATSRAQERDELTDSMTFTAQDEPGGAQAERPAQRTPPRALELALQRYAREPRVEQAVRAAVHKNFEGGISVPASFDRRAGRAPLPRGGSLA